LKWGLPPGPSTTAATPVGPRRELLDPSLTHVILKYHTVPLERLVERTMRDLTHAGVRRDDPRPPGEQSSLRGGPVCGPSVGPDRMHIPVGLEEYAQYWVWL
jgi:hypothetical protein